MLSDELMGFVSLINLSIEFQNAVFTPPSILEDFNNALDWSTKLSQFPPSLVISFPEEFVLDFCQLLDIFCHFLILGLPACKHINPTLYILVFLLQGLFLNVQLLNLFMDDLELKFQQLFQQVHCESVILGWAILVDSHRFRLLDLEVIRIHIVGAGSAEKGRVRSLFLLLF